jgi:hypothetical protein
LVEAVPVAVAAIMGGSYFTMRTVFKRFIGKRYRMLNGLMEKLAGYASGGDRPPLLEEMHAKEE